MAAITHLFSSAKALTSLRHHQHLIRMMVRRELAARYRGTVMGVFWSILHPLALLGLYTFVFSVILKVRFGSDGSTTTFALYLFCGMLPWLAFSEGVARSTSVILENANLVKKVVFPLEILPLNVVASALVTQAVGTLVLLAAALLKGVEPTWFWLLAPLLVIPQFLWTLGLGWFLASLGVYLRDVGQFIGLALTAWMFVTPIMYAETLIPAKYHTLMLLNPLATLIHGYRMLILEGQLPAFRPLAFTSLVGACVFLAGYAWFKKTQKGFADVL